MLTLEANSSVIQQQMVDDEANEAKTEFWLVLE
jgi:hypothetical protein